MDSDNKTTGALIKIVSGGLVAMFAVFYFADHLMNREVAVTSPAQPKEASVPSEPVEAVSQESVQEQPAAPVVKNGNIKLYYDDGTLKSEGFYINDKLHGPSTEYHANAKKRSLTNYRNGVPHGEQQQYYENGNLAMEASYNDGRFEGPYKRFNEDGTPMMEATYLEGFIHGERKDYFPDGVLKSIEHFENGQRVGVSQSFSSKGTLRTDNMYKNGFFDGLQREFYPDGKIKKEETYGEGVILNRKLYAESGALVLDVNF